MAAAMHLLGCLKGLGSADESTAINSFTPVPATLLTIKVTLLGLPTGASVVICGLALYSLFFKGLELRL
ncbi:hypothetical protein L209DRAFT_760392 [Thermothelomyces heterothallicus CBS 203.75]